MSRSALLTTLARTLRDAADAAALAAIPAAPTAGSHTGWADLEESPSWRSGAHGLRVAKFSFKGSTSQTLSGALYVGWNAADAVAEVIGKVNDGSDVTLAAAGATPARGYGQILYDVPGCYRFVTVIGTLTGGGTITIKATPLEVSE